MVRLRPVLGALVVAALTALAFCAGGPLTGELPRPAASPGEAALTAGATGLDPAVVPVRAEAQRDTVASQRTKQRVVLAAVAAAIVVLVGVARRRATVRGGAPRRLAIWLAVHGSRSPPPFQLLVP